MPDETRRASGRGVAATSARDLTVSALVGELTALLTSRGMSEPRQGNGNIRFSAANIDTQLAALEQQLPIGRIQPEQQLAEADDAGSHDCWSPLQGAGRRPARKRILYRPEAVC